MADNGVIGTCPESHNAQVIDFSGRITSTSDFEEEIDFQIIPNAASEYIQIQGMEDGENIKIEIRNSVSGISKSMSVRNGEKIDILDLPKGLYYLSVFDGLISKTKPFVKI